MERELRYSWDEENFQPWHAHSDHAKQEQNAFQELLRRRAGAKFFGANCFVATGAQILTSHFSIGQNSWVAAGAIIRGHVSIGANCSVNPYAHIAGTVTIGDGVRIAGLVSIYGFNHGFSRVDVPIYQQAATSKGIVIGDDTWIGANAVIVDGIKVGSHCIIAAGAIVTKDVPDYSIVAGNPAKIIKSRQTEPGAGTQRKTDSARIRNILYSEDPYVDLPFSYPPDLQGWGSNDPVFLQVISEIKPKLIVEVGTWKGASAIHMAEICSNQNLGTEIVCIDTWLGNWQHWSRDSGGVGSREDLKIVNGLPRLYYQFLANVIHKGFEKFITPLPLTGTAGAKLFEHYKLMADIVYIDGDHEYESVLFDIRLWLKQLAPGGVLIGDDYAWPGVKQAVDEIVSGEAFTLNFSGQKFTLRRKKGASSGYELP